MKSSGCLIPAMILVSILIQSTMSAGAKELCHPDDKKALLEIKAWFNNNYLFSSWFPDRDCCKEWYMVKCDLTTHRIISLSVATYDNISGTIPPSISDLPYLQSLTFRKLPNLTGSIPPSIATLRHLVSAQFDYNSLSGPVPSFFGRMPSLSSLTLAFNRFSGRIPPALALAPSLNYLDLSRNLLTGPIPGSFGRFNQSGESFTLILSHNQLSGPIPAPMASLDYISMDLSHNNITGDASLLFGRNKSVQIVNFSKNQLAFNFSEVVLPAGITSMDLSHNKIYGDLPVTGWDHVYYLNLSYNRLCGPIPDVIGKNSTFDQTVFFHNKCLCGSPLPPCKSTT